MPHFGEWCPRHWHVPEHQPDIDFVQANPVQNQWYTILETTNARIIGIMLRVLDTDETLELRITLDGQVYMRPLLATAVTMYHVILKEVGNFFVFDPDSTIVAYQYRAFLVEARSIKIEIRKTTIAGNGDLEADVIWAKW